MMFDNGEKEQVSQQRSVEDDTTLLMGLRRGLPEHSGESEPVLVTRARESVILTLDDGEQIVFDALELAAAVKPRLRLAA
jgi:hypothetical protein